MTPLKQTLLSFKPKGGKVTIKHKYPHRVEAIYREELRNVIVSAARKVVDVVKPMLLAESRTDERMDSSADIIRAIKAVSNINLNPDSIAKRVASSLRNNTEQAIGQAFIKAIGVSIIPPSSQLDSLVDLWVEQNITEIQNMHDAYITKVQRAVADGFKSGASTRDIAKEINKQTGASLKQAKRIARNETGNLNAAVTEQRDKDLGIDEYIWRTMRDARVRGAPEGGIGGLYPNAVPSHVEREGETYHYSNPPDGGNPGEAMMCRCYAEAVITF